MAEITPAEQIRLTIIKKVTTTLPRRSWPLTGLVIAI